MTPMQFCFWLAGILKMSKDDTPTDKLIREQLNELIKRETMSAMQYAVHPKGATVALLNNTVDNSLPGINVSTLPLLTEDPTGGFVSDR